MLDKFLVVGGGGFIGSGIARELSCRKVPHVLTSKRGSSVIGGFTRLDLNDDPSGWELPTSVNVAFLCASMVGHKHCSENESESRLVNVDRTLVLIDILISKGVFVVFLSSDSVFDGAQPYYNTDSVTSPVSEYAKQKTLVEQYIQKNAEFYAIVRLSKVLDHSQDLISGWMRRLGNHLPVEAFSNLFFSPVHLDVVSKVLVDIASARKSGIFHLAGSDVINYFSFAKALATEMGVNTELVKERWMNKGEFNMDSFVKLDISSIQVFVDQEELSPEFCVKKIVARCFHS